MNVATCDESIRQYRDAGQSSQTRKRADMMTLQGECVQPNHQFLTIIVDQQF